MYFKICFIASIIYPLFTDASNTSFRDASWPYDLKTDFSYPTYSLMRIDTSLARQTNLSTPLKITIPLSKKLYVTNNGRAIIAKLQEPSKNFTLSGGIFQDEIFDFTHVSYYWINDPLEFTGATVDDVGAPIVAVATFFNRRYKSFNYAKAERDGIVSFVVKVVVQGVVANKEFSKLEPALRSVTTAGSESETTVDAATSFFGLYPEPSYYAYPGSYYDSPNGKQIFSATIIELPKSHYPSISKKQFSAFTNCKNLDNSPIDFRLASFASDSRPLVQGTGIVHEPIS